MASTVVSLWPCVFCRLDLEFLGKHVDSGTVARLEAVAETPFKRLSYTEAVEILEEVVRSKKKKFEFPVRHTCAPRMPLPVADLCWCSFVLRWTGGVFVTHQLGRVADMPPTAGVGTASAQQRLTGRLAARR